MPNRVIVAVATILLAVTAASTAVLAFRKAPVVESVKSLFGASRYIMPATDIFGTRANKTRLSGDFATSTCFATADMDKLFLPYTYTPATANAFVGLWISATADKVVSASSSNWFPLSSNTAGTTEVDVFSDSGTVIGNGSYSTTTGAGYTGSGIPWIIPGDKTSVAGRAVSSTLELDTFSYTGLCVEPVESVTTGNGTLWMQVSGKAGQ